MGLSFLENPCWKLQADLLEIDVTQFVDQGQDGLELIDGAVVEVGGVKP